MICEAQLSYVIYQDHFCETYFQAVLWFVMPTPRMDSMLQQQAKYGAQDVPDPAFMLLCFCCCQRRLRRIFWAQFLNSHFNAILQLNDTSLRHTAYTKVGQEAKKICIQNSAICDHISKSILKCHVCVLSLTCQCLFLTSSHKLKLMTSQIKDEIMAGS